MIIANDDDDNNNNNNNNSNNNNNLWKGKKVLKQCEYKFFRFINMTWQMKR